MSEPIRLAIVGAAGRMGLEIASQAISDERYSIVSALESPGHPEIGKGLEVLLGQTMEGVVISDDLRLGFRHADVIIDLSSVAATVAVAEAAAQESRPLVCGTTGLSESERGALQHASNKIPVIETPNLSLGVAVMGALLEKAAAVLGAGYDIEIIETHHRYKRDAPSGTALALAKAAAQGRGISSEGALVCGRSGACDVRSPDEIGIHAVRGGGVFGEHTAVLAGVHERLEITHKAESRALFAHGALVAARFLVGKSAGLYSMTDVLAL